VYLAFCVTFASLNGLNLTSPSLILRSVYWLGNYDHRIAKFDINKSYGKAADANLKWGGGSRSRANFFSWYTKGMCSLNLVTFPHHIMTSYYTDFLSIQVPYQSILVATLSTPQTFWPTIRRVSAWYELRCVLQFQLAMNNSHTHPKIIGVLIAGTFATAQ